MDEFDNMFAAHRSGAQSSVNDPQAMQRININDDHYQRETVRFRPQHEDEDDDEDDEEEPEIVEDIIAGPFSSTRIFLTTKGAGN